MAGEIEAGMIAYIKSDCPVGNRTWGPDITLNVGTAVLVRFVDAQCVTIDHYALASMSSCFHRLISADRLTLDPASTLPPVPMTDAEKIEVLRDVLTKLVHRYRLTRIIGGAVLSEADDVLARTAPNS